MCTSHAFVALLQIQGPSSTLGFVYDDVTKSPYDHYELPFIGGVVEKLMGNGFRSPYTSAVFRIRYDVHRKMIVS